ncbi:ArdC-like ssDNA-binding domain-containing protein [Methylobacterium sp. HMF5984]|uniref:ArdC-like ssDNA-binding domain-containing protein n=1 Tax=Methylobacterium sp. HMF5984 TaxID=3367370 RepID=UPI003855409B
MAQNIHRIVTDKIIETMEAGEAGQWTCPWHRTGGGIPRNALVRRQMIWDIQRCSGAEALVHLG